MCVCVCVCVCVRVCVCVCVCVCVHTRTHLSTVLFMQLLEHSLDTNVKLSNYEPLAFNFDITVEAIPKVLTLTADTNQVFLFDCPPKVVYFATADTSPHQLWNRAARQLASVSLCSSAAGKTVNFCKLILVVWHFSPHPTHTAKATFEVHSKKFWFLRVPYRTSWFYIRCFGS
jgi:hypothetical protein